jgi:regulator of replication initiation timing
VNQETADMLRSILKEELAPINRKLEKLEQEVGELKRDVSVLREENRLMQQAIFETQMRLTRLNQTWISMRTPLYWHADPLNMKPF